MSAIIRLVAIFGAVALLAGCVVVGGRQTVQKPTRGQELTDLKTAYDAGALTAEEYECKRAEILRQ
jgi:hypothetical protein